MGGGRGGGKGRAGGREKAKNRQPENPEEEQAPPEVQDQESGDRSTYTQGEKKLKEKTLADIVSDRLRCNRRRSEANPTIFRQNRVKILEKISDNVTAPLF